MTNMRSQDQKQAIYTEATFIAESQIWDDKVISECCIRLEIEPALGKLLFPNGRHDLHSMWYSEIMLLIQEKSINDGETRVSNKMRNLLHKVVDHIGSSTGYKNIIHDQLQVCSWPFTLEKTWQLADNIWLSIGDQSTDMNYYTKRLLLSRIILKFLRKLSMDLNHDHLEVYRLIDDEIKKHSTFGKYKTKIIQYFKKGISLF